MQLFLGDVGEVLHIPERVGEFSVGGRLLRFLKQVQDAVKHGVDLAESFHSFNGPLEKINRLVASIEPVDKTLKLLGTNPTERKETVAGNLRRHADEPEWL